MGLAVAPPGAAVAASLANCTPGPCTVNPTGGLASTFTTIMVPPGGTPPITGEILQTKCIIPDTRVKLKSDGTWDGTCPGTLTINTALCKNFLPGTSYTLLPTICGATTGTAGSNLLAVIQDVAPGAEGKALTNVIVDSAATVSALIPGATDPGCLFGGTNRQPVVAWAPTAGEGTQPLGASTITNVTVSCQTDPNRTGGTRGPSLYVVGGNLSSVITNSTVSKVVYTDAQLVALGVVVVSANITPAARKSLLACLATAAGLLNTGKFVLAANQIAMCYSLVETNGSSFGYSTKYPNSLGSVLTGLQGVYYTMNSVISGYQTPAALQSGSL